MLLLPPPPPRSCDAKVPVADDPNRGLPDEVTLRGRFCDWPTDASGENNDEDEDIEECLLETCLEACGGGLKAEIVGESTLRDGLDVLDLACDKD